MELKLFVSDNLQSAEQQVNEWLHQSGAIVHHVTQSQSERNGRFVFVISIFYKHY